MVNAAYAYGQAREVKNIFTRIRSDLKILDAALDRESNLGPEAITDLRLQDQLQDKRLAIVTRLKKLANDMALVYEIKVESPALLLDILRDDE